MACRSSDNRLYIMRFFLFQLVTITLLPAGQAMAGLVPAMFVFGDSLVDDGNNNYLSSMAKANYYPYGIDFQGPSGRFSNGRNIVDVLCELLGIAYLPPYATPYLTGARMLGGVNYASAAGGILDESGQHLGERYTLTQQVLNFENNLVQIRDALGGTPEALAQYLAKSIVVVIIGSNDYINNYLIPGLYTASSNYNPEQYATLLLNRLARQVLALHSLGIRKVVLAGVGPLGCIPNQRAAGSAPPDRCVDSVNQILGFYNRGLAALVDQLNAARPGAVFAYGNTYGAMGDILNNPAAYGLTVIDRACCGVGRNRGEITCLPLQVPCPNRNEYAFWDAFHPTQAVNALLAQRVFSGPQPDMYPINLQQMAQL